MSPPLFKGAAHGAELDQDARDAVGQRVDQLLHLAFAAGSVGVTVGAHHHLVNTPRGLDFQVRVVGEERRDPLLLLLGEQVSAAAELAASRIQRIPGAAPVAQRLLLNPAAAQLKGACPANLTTWKGSITTVTSSVSSSTAAVLKPVNPSIATTSTASRQISSRSDSHVLNTCFERPSTMSSNRAGPVRSRKGVRSMMTVTYLSPRRVRRHTCSSLAPADELAAVYFQRWESEAAFGELKTHQRGVGVVLRSKLADGAIQEYGCLCVHYAMRWLMHTVATEFRKGP